jgi:acyl-CoA synthetase (NDP forming)
LLESALEHVRNQPTIDSVVLWHPHRLLDEQEGDGNAAALINSRAVSGKPHFHCGMQLPEIERRLVEAGVAAFQSPRRLFRALAAVVPRTDPVPSPPTRSDDAGVSAMTAADARALLDRIGVPSVATRPVANAAEAVAASEAWGAPIFLKLESRHASHKTEGGLVKGPLAGSSIRAAFDDLARAELAASDPDAQIVAQPLVTGIELALGGYVDPVFGPAVMVAHGGTLVEVLRDAAFAAAPVDRDRAIGMLRSLRVYPALAGARGHAADVAAAAEAIVALSRYMQTVADPALSIDINPLIVGRQGKGAVSVDARVEGVPSVAAGTRG